MQNSNTSAGVGTGMYQGFANENYQYYKKWWEDNKINRNLIKPSIH